MAIKFFQLIPSSVLYIAGAIIFIIVGVILVYFTLIDPPVRFLNASDDEVVFRYVQEGRVQQEQNIGVETLFIFSQFQNLRFL